MVQHILNDVDPGVRKTTLVSFFIYGISSCCTSVNWDAISSEAYFRQLIGLGCLFIWYSHYMPVGSDASPEQAAAAAKKKERTRAKSQHAQEHKKAALPGWEALLFKPSSRGEGGELRSPDAVSLGAHRMTGSSKASPA